MRKPIFARLVALTAAVALVTACATDQPTSPQASARARRAVAPPPALVSALLRTQPLAQNLVVSATIGPEGGSLQIPEAGLQLVVPAGAVQSPVVFTATALKGYLVAYDFSPAGATFNTPLQVTQALQGTWLERVPNLANLQGAYFASNTQLDQLGGQAYVNELLPTTLDTGSGKITFGVRHFSGYMVASGVISKVLKLL